MSARLLDVCVHEAGHASVALALGAQQVSMSICPEGRGMMRMLRGTLTGPRYRAMCVRQKEDSLNTPGTGVRILSM